MKVETNKPQFNIDLQPAVSVAGYQIRNKQIELNGS